MRRSYVYLGIPAAIALYMDPGLKELARPAETKKIEPPSYRPPFQPNLNRKERRRQKQGKL